MVRYNSTPAPDPAGFRTVRSGGSVVDERVKQILAAATIAAEQSGDVASERGGSLTRSLCVACAEATDVSGVGLALMSDRGHDGLVAATDGPATVMEELQFGLGEGPCVDASSSGRPVLQPDLRHSGPQRWPGFAPAALEAGIAAIFALPLQVGPIRLGVLDLYRDTPGPLTAEQLTDALAYADGAAIMLLRLQQSHPVDGELHPDLIDASHDLAEVHQATGMVAVQASMGLGDALLLLRAHAFSSGRNVLAVANEVLQRQIRFDSQD